MRRAELATVLVASLILGACTTARPPLPTVQSVNLERYVGTWYEIALVFHWKAAMVQFAIQFGERFTKRVA